MDLLFLFFNLLFRFLCFLNLSFLSCVCFNQKYLQNSFLKHFYHFLLLIKLIFLNLICRYLCFMKLLALFSCFIYCLSYLVFFFKLQICLCKFILVSLLFVKLYLKINNFLAIRHQLMIKDLLSYLVRYLNSYYFVKFMAKA